MRELYSDPQRIEKIQERSCMDILTQGHFFRCLAIDPMISPGDVYDRVISTWSTVGLLATLSLAFSISVVTLGHEIDFPSTVIKDWFGATSVAAFFFGMLAAFGSVSIKDNPNLVPPASP